VPHGENVAPLVNQIINANDISDHDRASFGRVWRFTEIVDQKTVSAASSHIDRADGFETDANTIDPVQPAPVQPEGAGR
jgi:hypothetical protein